METVTNLANLCASLLYVDAKILRKDKNFVLFKAAMKEFDQILDFNLSKDPEDERDLKEAFDAINMRARKSQDISDAENNENENESESGSDKEQSLMAKNKSLKFATWR